MAPFGQRQWFPTNPSYPVLTLPFLFHHHSQIDTGFLADEDVRIVTLLIKNQISFLLKERQNMLKDQMSNEQNASVTSETSTRFEMIQQQQQHYKHTEIPVTALMEENVVNAFIRGKLGEFDFRSCP